jgi:hypothetical protein
VGFSHARGSCLAVTFPLNLRINAAPHRSETTGMEGSAGTFVPLHGRLSRKGIEKNRPGEAERPMTANLPTSRCVTCQTRFPIEPYGWFNEYGPVCKNCLGYSNTLEFLRLPEIRYSQMGKHCADCNKPTHLHWQSQCVNSEGRIIHAATTHNSYWLCQGCGKRRAGRYLQAIQRFLNPAMR